MHLIAEDILTFWFGTTDLSTVMERRQPSTRWFRSTPEFDATLRERYTEIHGRAAGGAFDGFVETREECLALMLALDQFPRNIFRGMPRAFASDAKARGIARIALNRGYDEGICPAFRVFFYLPFEHSENIADQDRVGILVNAGLIEDALELYEGRGWARSDRWRPRSSTVTRFSVSAASRTATRCSGGTARWRRRNTSRSRRAGG